MCEQQNVLFSRKQWIATILLTGGCVGAYIGLRLVPVEACEVLHYGDYVNADGVIEGCGFEETGFFDLEAMRFPVIARLESMSEPTIGEETLFQLSLETSVGRAISYEDIAVSHTERVHAMIVDPSLEDYQHLHPVDGGGPGTYTFRFTPRRAGEYRIYLDFIPLKTARRTLAEARFEVAGTPTAPVLQPSRERRTEDGLTVRLVSDVEKFETGAELPFRLEVESAAADALVFDPVMDSYAHLVAFTPGRRGFAHFHPLNPVIAEQDARAPELEFLFSVEDAGMYRVWAQFSVNGEERFVPFDLEVKSAG
jgi:hypothetical protein